MARQTLKPYISHVTWNPPSAQLYPDSQPCARKAFSSARGKPHFSHSWKPCQAEPHKCKIQRAQNIGKINFITHFLNAQKAILVGKVGINNNNIYLLIILSRSTQRAQVNEVGPKELCCPASRSALNTIYMTSEHSTRAGWIILGVNFWGGRKLECPEKTLEVRLRLKLNPHTTL